MIKVFNLMIAMF